MNALIRTVGVTVVLMVGLPAGSVLAASAVEIDARAAEALDQLRTRSAAAALLDKAAGVLVFPRVLKAGFGLGGHYGEGTLQVGGKSVGYYNVAAASFGFQLGGQVRKQAILFMTDEALESFQHSRNWRIGVDGSVAVATAGVGEEIDNSTAQAPVIGFVFGNKGLMYNLTLDGSKISPIQR